MKMAQPIMYVDRLRIIKMRQSGCSFAKIAQELGYSADGVRKIWKRFETQGQDGLKTSYQNSGVRSPYSELKALVKAEKTGEQGAPYIRSVLMSLYPEQDIPHERTIQRWWEAERGKKKLGKLDQNA